MRAGYFAPVFHVKASEWPAASMPQQTMVTVSLPDPAQTLLKVVAEAIRRVLVGPMNDKEIAAALDVSPVQVKTWLQRLFAAGVVENARPPGSTFSDLS